MDILLFTLGLMLVILGILGSFLPVLPGPPLSWLGLAMLYWTDAVASEPWILWGAFAVAVMISVLDYVIPAMGTKRFGGTRKGIWGTNIGLVIGLIAPIPMGVIIGPFLGALAGELLHDATDFRRAFRAATGSFLGFLTSTFIKLVYGIAVAVYFIYLSTVHASAIFQTS